MIPAFWLYRILGVACVAAALLGLVASRDRWKDRSNAFAKLYAQEQAAHFATIASYRAAAEQARRRSTLMPGQRPSNRGSTKGQRMITKAALSLLGLMLSACATQPLTPAPLPALAAQRQCTPFPTPPEELMKPPVKIDFQRTIGSSPPSRQSNSTS